MHKQTTNAQWAANEFYANDQVTNIVHSMSPWSVDLKGLVQTGILKLIRMSTLAIAVTLLLLALMSSRLKDFPKQRVISAVAATLCVLTLTWIAFRIEMWSAELNAICMFGWGYSLQNMLAELSTVALSFIAPVAAVSLPIICIVRWIYVARRTKQSPFQVICQRGPVTTLVLLLLYSLLLIPTVRLEARETYVLDQTLTHEGQFFAMELHRTWPS